jgi:uncharacterized protein (DUF58 family)
MTVSRPPLRIRQMTGWGTGLSNVLERIGITITGAALVCLVVLGWLAARAIGSRTMYLMAYAALAMMGMAWFAARRRLTIDVERSDLPMRMRAGQHVGVNLKITSRRRTSMIVLEEKLHPQLGSTVSIPVASLKGGQEFEHAYSFVPAMRGVYEVGPLTATWSDPFGFTTHSQVLAPAAEIIVHPPTEKMRDRVLTRMWEDPPVRPPVSKPWPVGFEFYGMRDYVPGDDLRRVVWTAYAKTGRLLVRESEQGITDRVVIVVDTDAEWHSPGEVSDTFETAVRVAASAGVQHLEDGFSVTLMSNEGILAHGLRGATAHLTLLDRLARIELGKTPLVEVGFSLLQEARNRPHVLIVTPHVGKAEATQLKLIVDRGLSVVIAKILWDESDPMSLARAASLGAHIVQIPEGASLQAVFAHRVSAGRN